MATREPVIRNFSDAWDSARYVARLITIDDGPPTCTIVYQDVHPGAETSHHLHSWEHEVYIIGGSGTQVCDGKEYPIKEGDAILVPPNVDHVTRNNGGDGVLRRIEVNPLVAAGGGAITDGKAGSGAPPMIRNHRDLNQTTGSRIISIADGAPNYVMLYNGAMAPGAVSEEAAGGHIHAWEHMVYILEGSGTLFYGGKEYPVTQGDGVFIPGDTWHQWRNTSQAPLLRITCNPLAADRPAG